MRRWENFHELLIPILVEGIGAQSYLELGTHLNGTISKVNCPKKYGVDLRPVTPCDGAWMWEGSTETFIREMAPTLAPFDFCFLDADHAQAAVRSDFFGIWPYISDEGLVCIHDSNPETKEDASPGLCGDTWEFVKLLQEESVTLPFHPGLTIVRKRVRWGPQS